VLDLSGDEPMILRPGIITAESLEAALGREVKYDPSLTEAAKHVEADPADGVSKSATDNLVSYSKDATCSQILMESAAVYLADTLDEGAIAAMQANGIYSIWFEGETLRFNQTDIHLRLDESLNYTAQLVK
jgi:hypothetical protein